jgi:Tol biopolymer transport system component/DNA-binding winged helix-turn-helix (wHTH) protein
LEIQGFEFGEFYLDASEKVLLRGGKPVALTPKAIQLLFVLVENHGRIVEKEDLMKAVWAKSFVEDSNLTFTISLLRKALNDDDKQRSQFIETVPKRGYRFVGQVTPLQLTNLDATSVTEIENSNGHGATANKLEFSNNYSQEQQSVSESSRLIRRLFFGHSRPILFSMAAILIGCFLTGFFLLGKRPSFYQKLAGRDTRFLSVEKLTNTGEASGINISRDGKFFVYLTHDDGKNTIWLRLAGTGKTIPIYSSADESFNTAGFSSNGERIYFTHKRGSEPLKLSGISILGGTPTLIVSGLHNGWSFSPDESQVAFIRFDGQATRLIISDVDGKNEREILTSPPSRHLNSVSWSPDGKTIAYCSDRKVEGGTELGIYGFDLADKTEKSLTDFKWGDLENILWLPDQSGMLVTARGKNDGVNQIWRLSFPDGHAEKITNDSSSLSLNGATADLTKILATQFEDISNVWVAPKDNPSDAHAIAKSEFDLAWTHDDKIIFQSRDMASTDLWLTTADGGDKKQLTVDDSSERSPAVSPDGSFIAYVSTRDGQQDIWRMDADGGNQTQLTSGGGANFPTFTRDGQWVVYTLGKDRSLWEVPVAGGSAQQISKAKHRRVTISPDGTKLAHIEYVDGHPKLLIESFPGCVPAQQFDAKIDTPSFIRIVWSKNGKSVVYFNIDSNSIGNLWQQSLEGGNPQQLTNFNSERILDFDISPGDGQIAFVRSTLNFDAVLLTGMK